MLIVNSSMMPATPRTRPKTPPASEQHDALGEQFADDPPAPAADCGDDGHLPLPAGRAHEQQVGDVGAGDEQHAGLTARASTISVWRALLTNTSPNSSADNPPLGPSAVGKAP